MTKSIKMALYAGFPACSRCCTLFTASCPSTASSTVCPTDLNSLLSILRFSAESSTTRMFHGTSASAPASASATICASHAISFSTSRASTISTSYSSIPCPYPIQPQPDSAHPLSPRRLPLLLSDRPQTAPVRYESDGHARHNGWD